MNAAQVIFGFIVLVGVSFLLCAVFLAAATGVLALLRGLRRLFLRAFRGGSR